MSNVAHAIDNSPLVQMLQGMVFDAVDSVANGVIDTAAGAAEGIAHGASSGFGALLGGFDLGKFGNGMGLGGENTVHAATPAVLEVGAADVGPTVHETAHALPEGVMEVSFDDITAPTFAGAGHTGQSAGIGW